MGRRFSKTLGRKTHGNPQANISTLNEEEALELLDNLNDDPFILILDQVKILGTWVHVCVQQMVRELISL